VCAGILAAGFGNTPGPYREYRAWGPNLTALAGVDHLTGWPDRPASGLGSIALPDYLNGLHAFYIVLAALCFRDVTGEGQYIDMSQFEVTVGALGPTILDYSANGNVPSRAGNRVAYAAPQGVYPARGADRWVAITVCSDEQWRALCQVADHPEWIEDPRFYTFEARSANHDDIDERIASWTSGESGDRVATMLQDAGIPAAAVQDMRDLAQDEHLHVRDFWKLLDNPRFGRDLVTGHPIRLSDSPALFDRGGPAFGQDNDYVLRELCQLSPAELESLAHSGAVETLADSNTQLRRPYWARARDLMPGLDWPSVGDE